MSTSKRVRKHAPITKVCTHEAAASASGEREEGAYVKVERPRKITCLHCRRKKVESMNGYCEKCLSLVGDREVEKLRGRRRCVVKDCANHTDQGMFVGDLCFPCHRYVTSGAGHHSQAFRNSLRTFVVGLANHLLKVLDPTFSAPSIADEELLRMIRG